MGEVHASLPWGDVVTAPVLSPDEVEEVTRFGIHDDDVITVLEDTFPHGTRDGYEQGCKGGHCPAGEAHGLSCQRAKQLAAGDYRYQKLTKRGLEPWEIALELGLTPETFEPPAPKKREPEDDAVVDEAGEEPVMEQTKVTPKDVAPKTKPTTAEIRAWAVSHGIDVPVRGVIRTDVRAAFEANDPSLVKTHAERVGIATEKWKPSKPKRKRKPAVTPDPVVEPVADPEPPEVAETFADARDSIFGSGDITAEGWEWPAEHMNATLDAVAGRDPLAVIREELAQLVAHVAHLTEERDQARTALDVTLRLWAVEKNRADVAEALLVGEQALVRLYRELLADAEARRPWWKRAAS